MRRRPDPGDEHSFGDAMPVPSGAEDVAVYDTDIERSDAMSKHIPTPWHRSLILGKWYVLEGARVIAEVAFPDDATSIALDHNAVNAHAALLSVLEAVEWVDAGLNWYCPSCRGWKREGHAPDCQLAAALRDAKGE